KPAQSKHSQTSFPRRRAHRRRASRGRRELLAFLPFLLLKETRHRLAVLLAACLRRVNDDGRLVSDDRLVAGVRGTVDHRLGRRLGVVYPVSIHVRRLVSPVFRVGQQLVGWLGLSPQPPEGHRFGLELGGQVLGKTYGKGDLGLRGPASSRD